MALARGGVTGFVIGMFILVVVVGYMAQQTAEIESDIDINATENPEAASAVDAMFQKSYKAQQSMGSVIQLSAIGIIIAVVSGFLVYTRR